MPLRPLVAVVARCRDRFEDQPLFDRLGIGGYPAWEAHRTIEARQQMDKAAAAGQPLSRHAYVVDNGATTARLGTQKRAPRFDWALTRHAYPLLGSPAPDVSGAMERFLGQRILSIMAKCGELFPSVDILVE